MRIYFGGYVSLCMYYTLVCMYINKCRVFGAKEPKPDRNMEKPSLPGILDTSEKKNILGINFRKKKILFT